MNDVIKALEMCTGPHPNCPECPYYGVHKCSLEMTKDALALLLELKENKYDAK